MAASDVIKICKVCDQPRARARLLIVFLPLIFSAFLCRSESPADLTNAYIAAIGRLQSYDATFQIKWNEYLNFDNLKDANNAPQTSIVQTNRDVFAVGLGRRLEQCVGDEAMYNQAAIGWAAATAGKDIHSKPFTMVLPGLTYHDYFNPESGLTAHEVGLFLADLLKNKQTKTKPLAPTADNPNLSGFEVSHPGIKGPIRVWLDPQHGDMPARIDWYKRQNGKLVLDTRVQVAEFIQPDGETWVPLKASLTAFIPNGPIAGRAYRGFTMELDPARSSWNTIKSAELFSAKSIKTVNHEERGWMFYYPPKLLPSIKQSAAIQQQILSQAHHHHGAFFSIVIVILLALPVAIFAWLRSSQSRAPVHQ